MLNDTTITEALRTVQDPELHRDIVSLDMVKEIHIDGEAVALQIDLTPPACPLKDQIIADQQEKMKFIFEQLGIRGNKATVEKFINAPVRHKPLPASLKA